MARDLFDPDANDIFEWSERVTDINGDDLTLGLILDAVDDGTGFSNDGRSAGDVPWLSFTVTENTLTDGTREEIMNISADESGLTTGYTYRMKVTADDGVSYNPVQERTFLFTVDETPSAPTGLSADWSNSAASLSWDVNPENDIDGYNVYRSQTSGGPYNQVNGALVTTNSYTDSSVSSGTRYFYVITAVDDTSAESQFSSEAAAGGVFRSGNYTLVNNTDLSTNVGSNLGSDGRGISWVGSDLFLVSQNSDRLLHYTFGTAGDISTLSFGSSFSVPFDFPVGCAAKPDGTVVYVADDAGGGAVIIEYTLSTPYDVSTASQTNSFTPTNLPNHPAFSFVDSGNLMFGVESVNDGDDIVHRWELGTAYDFSTYQNHTSQQFADASQYFGVDANTSGMILGANPAQLYRTSGGLQLADYNRDGDLQADNGVCQYPNTNSNGTVILGFANGSELREFRI